jgi:hypothetical protein
MISQDQTNTNSTTNMSTITQERIDQLLAKLTNPQLRFVVAMQDCKDKKEAAAAVGIKPNTIYKWPPRRTLRTIHDLGTVHADLGAPAWVATHSL